MPCRPQTLIAAAFAALAFQATAHASEQIATKAGCTACHAVDRKMVGPSYKEIAARYKGKGDAAAVLAERVRTGSKGVWGQVPMPATDAARLSDGDLKAVVAWLLKA